MCQSMSFILQLQLASGPHNLRAEAQTVKRATARSNANILKIVKLIVSNRVNK